MRGINIYNDKTLRFDLTGTKTIIHKPLMLGEQTMYQGDEPMNETTGGINECRRPRNGITARVSPININGENGIAYELDDIVYTDQSVILKVLEGKLDKLTGEWKNWLARNTE